MGVKKFNLLREPWIKVLLIDGSRSEMSIKEIFREAHKIKKLDGELTTQDIAILRLLLAILHSIFGKKHDGQYVPLENTEFKGSEPDFLLSRWKSLWDMGAFPYDVIEAYLDRNEDNFYLIHPERPFYQIAGLDIGTKYLSAKINGELAESNNKLRLFPMRTGAAKENLTLAEGARWLLHLNGFDDASGKPTREKAIPGQEKVKKPSVGVGWLGQLGLIYAQGETLYETLLLNFVLLKDGGFELWDIERPNWEREKPKADERTEISVPNNQAELLTLQSRRIIFDIKDDQIKGYRLIGGDFFNTEQEVFVEQMTCWIKARDTDRSSRSYRPKPHMAQRMLWRDLSNLLGQSDTSRLPGIVAWLARLRRFGILKRRNIKFQTASIEYGDKNSAIQDIVQDEIAFSSTLLAEDGIWAKRVIEEIATAENMVNQVVKLAIDVAKASGASDIKGVRDSAREQMYYALDLPFREWLVELDPETSDIDDACEKWWNILQQIVRRKGREIVSQAGVTSLVGRGISEKGKSRHYSAPQSFNYFMLKTSSRDSLKGGG